MVFQTQTVFGDFEVVSDMDEESYVSFIPPDYNWYPHRRSGDGGDWSEDAKILPFWKYGQPH